MSLLNTLYSFWVAVKNLETHECPTFSTFYPKGLKNKDKINEFKQEGESLWAYLEWAGELSQRWDT